MEKILTVFIFLVTFGFGFSQTALKGVVSDDTGEPLIGATVLIKDTSIGAVTDIEGKYHLSGLTGGEYIVVVSYVGYKTEERTVTIQEGETLVQNFILAEESELLDEVVVVGYGVQRKRDVSGSIAKVAGIKLQATITPSFESSLQGQAAGVSVIQGSGIAGSGSIIRVRGISSISATAEPLYVVDGIPIDVNYFLAEANWQNGAFNNNPLAVLNPNDIASVEILKDASAAGIYGSRGANGVILITTKRGKSNKLSLDFSSRIATSDPVAKPDFLNSTEWLALRQEAWELDGNTGTVWLPNYSSESDSEEFKQAAFQKASLVNTDWWDELTQQGLKFETNLGANFGWKNLLKAYVGYTYSNSDSYIIGNNLKKHNIRGNFDFDISKSVKFRVSGSYNYGVNQRVRVAYTGGLGDAMSIALPIYPIYTEDGSFWRGENSGSAPNPVYTNQNYEGFTVDNRTLNTAQLIYTPSDRFNVIFNGGYDRLTQLNDQYEEYDYTNTLTKRAERDSRKVINYNANLVSEYAFVKNKNNTLKTLIGTELQRKVTSGFNNLVYKGVESTQFIGKGDFSAENVDSTNYNELANDKESFISYFTRINYAYKNRYFLQASGRVDGSSKFGTNNKYGFFPSVSAGWLISEEPFFKKGIISFLKLKASFGILGNSGLPANQWIGTIATTGHYNNDPIRYTNKIQNPDLKWETTNTFDLGLEYSFLDDAIHGEVSYYRKYTKDALLNITTPGYFGFNSFWDNIAEILNTGVEADLTIYPVNNKFLKWKSSLNLAYNYNEIISIGDYTEDAVSGGTNDTRVVEGYPVGTNFLIRSGGVDAETGRPIYIDINGNETFEYNESRDRVPVGDVLPDFTGGWNNSFSVGQFGLNFLFVFSSGFDIYDSSSKRQLAFLSDWNVDRRIAERWKKPGDNATYPKVTLNPAEHGNDKEWFNTDVWLNDGSYIRLRNISLTYNIPSKWLKRMKLQSASFALGGTNLLTLTNYRGLDPEVVRDFDNTNDRNLSPNITYLTPPQEKSFSLSLNIKF